MYALAAVVCRVPALSPPPCCAALRVREPPLLLLGACREAFVMSRTKVNLRRIQMALVGLRRLKRKFEAIKASSGGGGEGEGGQGGGKICACAHCQCGIACLLLECLSTCLIVSVPTRPPAAAAMGTPVR